MAIVKFKINFLKAVVRVQTSFNWYMLPSFPLAIRLSVSAFMEPILWPKTREIEGPLLVGWWCTIELTWSCWFDPGNMNLQ